MAYVNILMPNNRDSLLARGQTIGTRVPDAFRQQTSVHDSLGQKNKHTNTQGRRSQDDSDLRTIT